MAGPDLGGSATRLALDDPAWLRFVESRPDALPYHHPAWAAVIASTYRYDAFAACIRDVDGELLAGMPFVSVGGRARGRRWIGLPFTDACPPLAASAAAGGLLGAALARARDEHGLARVEVRSPLDEAPIQAVRGVTHRLALGDTDAVYGGFEPQVRRNIRKAERSEVDVRVATCAEDLTRIYYALHATTRRRLGVPTQPRRFFDALWHSMIEPGYGWVLLAYTGDTPIAAAVFLEWNGSLVYKFGASDDAHRDLRPNNLIFWEAIKRGCASGAHTLDFGRSDLHAEGLRSFKKSWGAVESELVYSAFGDVEQERSSLSTAEHLVAPLLRAAPTWVGRGLGEVFYRLAA